ncbi:MAG: ComEC/Rec2 family competence protein [Patescibacteria group bacterium]
MFTKKSKTWLVFISLIVLITFRFITTRPVYKDGQNIRITTTVLVDPIKYERSQYFKTAGLKVYLPLIPEIIYGDKIVIEGTVNDRELINPTLKNLEAGQNNFLGIRHKIISFYQSVLPEPYAGLLAGITIGSKGGLTNDFWNKVKNTGVAHVVVASGMNVTFVTAFLVNFLVVFLPRRKSIPFVILGILLYLFISGFEAPLVRAAIMGIVVFGAQETGRIVSASRALILSACCMLIIKPEWLIDIGFILSFVATGSILIFEPKIRSKLNFLPEVLKEGLSTSLAAQIGVTPILFVTFGQFNILSPIINGLILWTVPFIMILGVIGGVLGLVIPILGKLILYISYPLLWWFVSIVTLLDF